jgi:hypothetical protein
MLRRDVKLAPEKTLIITGALIKTKKPIRYA